MKQTRKHDSTGPMTIEIASDRIVCRWGNFLKSKCNPVDEEILLTVLQGESLIASLRVEHLTQKEIHLDPGEYLLQLARFSHRETELRSSLAQTPSLSWIQDSPSSHLITWSGIDWESVRTEVEQVHQLDWTAEAAVSLRVLSSQRGKLKNDWIPVPERDHCTLDVLCEEVELAVVSQKDNTILKSLFIGKQRARKPLQILARQDFHLARASSKVALYREIVETDTLQVRAEWSDLGEKEYQITLMREGATLRTEGPVSGSGDWLFPIEQAGHYRVELTPSKDKSGSQAWSSPEIHVTAPQAKMRLLPISESRAYAYWHVGQEVWQSLNSEFGDIHGRVQCFLQVGVVSNEEVRVLGELTRPVDTGSTKDYYLDLPPDFVYKARLIARIGHDARKPLTQWSNPCQLARINSGRAPITHIKHAQPNDHPTVRQLSGPTGTHRFSKGYLLLHLHAHLPFISDPVNFGKPEAQAWRPIGYPQEWYPEAVCDTYLPLIDLFETLRSEGVDFKLSMDISPPLVAMMKSQRHASDVLSFLERLIQLSRLEVERTRYEDHRYQAAASMHLKRFLRCRDLFLGHGGDIVEAFKKFQELGHLELSTCVGTHPMLPLWTSEPSFIRGQCLAAAESHEKYFGRAPQGVWLPECAYTPGIESFLEDAGFRYTFGEEHCVSRGDAPAEFGVNAPVYTKGGKIAIFPRDPETGKQVWSGDEGYPGDPDYLEFHIRGGAFKYNRITDRRGGHKEPYNPEWASQKAANHAGHFLDCRNARFSYLQQSMWKKPVICAPYDAELFGHHWYEGPQFLYYLFKKLHYDQNVTELTTPSAYLAGNSAGQEMFCNVSSWGHMGTFEKWMVGATSWMYRHAHEAAQQLSELSNQGADNELQHRVLSQAARQLMIATSSDLPFVISNGHFVDRMKEQFSGNLKWFYALCEDFSKLKNGAEIDHERLRSLELENCIFPDLKLDSFRS